MIELYQLQEIALTPGGVRARVRLNPEHDIFRGHFPGQPVMPGVCMMELVCDLAGKKAGMPLRILSGPLIKFLNMVDPGKTGQLEAEMTLVDKDSHLQVSGRLFSGDIVFVRFQLTLGAVPQTAVAPPGIS